MFMWTFQNIGKLYFEIDKHSVPIKHKRQVTDVEMEVRRAKEEITLIEQEMINFITFYKCVQCLSSFRVNKRCLKII